MATKTQVMDRSTDACKTHLGATTTKLDIRQSRKGWFQELLGCEAKTELNYFTDDGKTKIATSVEDTDCFCRMCCTAIHPFTMRVNEVGTQAEILTVERPLACGVGSCKCCCYQSATVTSGGTLLATVQEGYYYCVPTFHVTDGTTGDKVYTIHPPTCCGGMCVNICAEGNPCGKGFCKYPFWVFDATASGSTEGSDAPKIGKIVKLPKSMAVELFTDADAFEVSFPESATVDQKAALVGTAVFLNAAFFEAEQGDDGAGMLAAAL